ncbi:MAG: DUF2637 domain-containing protein [Micromonosporaceae bacterium]|nr:DUF2637 domain-containing protein [Micromonosporaceae bacterium]
MVAAIAAWSSYSHMVHVALAFGERPEVAYALPFSVDGMLVVSSVVMVDDKGRGLRVRPVARLAFTAGVLASVAANIAAAHPSVGARAVAAWPAIALLLVVEMLARPPGPATAVAEPVARRPAVRPAATPPVRRVPAGSASQAATRVPVPPVPLAAVAGQGAPEVVAPRVPPAAAAGVPPGSTPAGLAVVGGGGRVEEADAVVAAGRRRPTAATRRLACQIIEAEPQLSRSEVAARLGVSTRRLREVLATPA